MARSVTGVVRMNVAATDPTTAFTTGLNELNYTFLPAGAFDSNGNLSMPAGFSLPAGWSETVGRVTASPDFVSLLKILGVLTVSGTDWWCWRVALSFHDGTLRVVIARPTGAVGDNEQIALNWANNLWSVVLTQLKSYAGRKRAVPQVATDALTAVIDAVTQSGYWNRPQNDDRANAALALTKWKVTSALGLVKSFAELIAGITVSSKVLTTVLWFDATHPSVPADQIRWSPLHQLYDGMGARAIHYRWNSGWPGPPPTYPFVYSSSLKRRGWGVTDVAHQPWDLARALYPNGDWPDLDAQSAAAARARCRRVLVDNTWTWICDETVELAESPLIRPESVPFPRERSALEVQVRSEYRNPGNGFASEDLVEKAVQKSRPLVVAHDLPWRGGDPLAEGALDDGRWTPIDDDPKVPPLLWLPATGEVAAADEYTQSWRPVGEIPAVVTRQESQGGNVS